MAKIGWLVIFFFISNFAFAQFDTSSIKKNIVEQSDSMFAAFKTNDWNTFSNFMHPKLIQLANGKEAFVGLLKTEMSALAVLKFTEVKHIGNIQIINGSKSMQCIVQYGLEMMIDTTLISGATTSIGESTDKGKTWKFVRNIYNTYDEIKKGFPWIYSNLMIPKEEQKFGISLANFLKTYTPNYVAMPIRSFAIKNKYSRKIIK